MYSKVLVFMKYAGSEVEKLIVSSSRCKRIALSQTVIGDALRSSPASDTAVALGCFPN